MRRPCIVCGVLLTKGSRCKAHSLRQTPGRTSTEQASSGAPWSRPRAADASWIEDGARCERTTGLSAHHLTSLVAGGSNDPRNGVLLCGPHHARAEALDVVAPAAPSYPIACA